MSGSCSRPISFHAKAASEDLTYGRMEDELTCPVCLELFADPLMLPCSHSICKKCLADICSSRSKHGKDGLECPACRKLLPMSAEQISKLPRNLALENIVFRFQEIRSCSMTKSKSLDLTHTPVLDTSLTSEADLPVFGDEGVDCRDCSLCEGSGTANKAQYYCQQCSVLYCQLCLDSYHPRRGPLSLHKLRKPSSCTESVAPLFCEDHEHETATIFCDKCKVLVCHLCVCDGIGKHSGHKILSQDAAAKQLREDVARAKERLDGLLTTVCDKNARLQEMTDDVQHVAKEARERVDNQCRSLLQDLTAALMNHRDLIKADLDLLEGQQRSLYSGHLSRGQGQLTKIEEHAAACKQLLEHESMQSLLMQAAQLQPIQEGIQTLQTQVESDDLTFKSLPSAPRVQQDIKSVVQGFRPGAVKALSRLTESEDSQCECLVPTVKSTVTSPGGKSEIPRVQNRCLITWGFNFTTFTAEPLSSNSLWSVTIGKNTNKIGDIKSGYAFGMGISAETFNLKEQVGMNAKSYGIVCHNGNLSYCHDSRLEPLMPLYELPISVTIAVVMDKPGHLALSYSLTNSTWGDTLLGKRIIVNKAFGSSFFPVFSVSQRVKMQFQSFL